MTSTVVLAAPTEIVLAEPGGWEFLTASERARAEQLRFGADRRDFVAAHVLARRCAGRALATGAAEITIVQVCPTCGGPHGPPSVREAPDLGLSISHTEGYVAAIAGPPPVGVDVERIPHASPSVDLTQRVLSRAEDQLVRASWDAAKVFARIWVCKEALVKVGELTLDEMSTLDLSLFPDRWGTYSILAWENDTCTVVGAAIAREVPQLVNS